MRVVFIGAAARSVAAARILVKKGHEVVIVERDEEVVDRLRDELDCGFVVGDGSRPAVLADVSPENTDYLFCLSSSDQDNIIAALVGRKLGFENIVVHIVDPDFESICAELDIDDTIIPDQEIGRALARIAEGEVATDYHGSVREGARFFDFVVADGVDGPLADYDFDEEVRIVAVTRGDRTRPANEKTQVESGDEVLLIAAEEKLEELRERFKQKPASSVSGDSEGSGTKDSD